MSLGTQFNPQLAPVLVQGKIGAGLTAARVIAHLVSMTAVIGALAELYSPAWVLLPLSASIAVEVVAFRRRAKRVWITDSRNGFRVESKQGIREYDDDDVYSVNAQISKVYVQGRYNGERKVFVLQVAGEERPITLDYHVGVHEMDPLAEFTARVLERYVARADEALKAGVVLQGDGWSLSHSEFTVKARGSAETVPLSELVSVEDVDGYVQLWKRGVDAAFFKIPTRSQHATLVLQLLAPRVASGSIQEVPAQGLGRVIFERRSSRVIVVMLWILGIVCCLPAIGGCLAAIQEPELWVMGAIFSLAAASIISVAFSLGRSRFRCQQFGVHHKGIFTAARQLRYEEIDEFTYMAIRQYHNGIYIGTSLTITLKPPAGSDKKRIRYFTGAKQADSALEQLRDYVASAVGAKLLERIDQGEHVPWAKSATLTPEGIEYRPGGFVARKDPIFIPFAQVQRFDMQEGTFYLWQHGNAKSAMQLSCQAPNFYPGFWALCQLLQSRMVSV